MRQQKEISDSRGDFTLTEALVSIDTIKKMQKEFDKIQKEMNEIQFYVKNHNVQINSNLVDETKLKVTVEIFQKDFFSKYNVEKNIFQGTILQKMKKRPKMKEVEQRLADKVQYSEFKKVFETMDNNFKLLEARVNHQINLIKADTAKNIERKADQKQFDLLTKDKADKTELQQIIEKMTSLEALAKQALEEESDSDDSNSEDELGDMNDDFEGGVRSQQRRTQGVGGGSSFMNTMAPKNSSLAGGDDQYESLLASHKGEEARLIIQQQKTSRARQDNLIRVIDGEDQNNRYANMLYTQEEFKNKKLKVNIPQPSVVEENDQVKFRESQSEVSAMGFTKRTLQQTQQTLRVPDGEKDSTKTKGTANQSERHGKKSTTDSKNPFKKKSQKKLEKLQHFVHQMFDDVQKRLNDNRAQIVDISELTQMLIANNKIQDLSISTHNEMIEKSIKPTIEKMEKEIERLQRIDVKLNKELVVKPYNYIDKIKEQFEKEWDETKKKLTSNNEKYMGKFVTLEANVNRLITDSEILIDQYKKKIGDIGKDLQSIKTIKDTIETKLTNNQSTVTQLQDKYNKDLQQMKKDLEAMKTQLKNEISNLKEENHGFHRELQRAQQLSREIHQEFQTILHQKKGIHEDLVNHIATVHYATKGKNNEKSPTGGGESSNLALLLPTLKAQSNLTNIETNSRQVRLAKLFSDKKSVDYTSISNLSSVRKQPPNLNFTQASIDEKAQSTQQSFKQKSKTPLRKRQVQQRGVIEGNYTETKQHLNNFSFDNRMMGDGLEMMADDTNGFKQLHQMIGGLGQIGGDKQQL